MSQVSAMDRITQAGYQPVSGPVEATDKPSGSAQVRIVHIAPDLPPIDVYFMEASSPDVLGLSYAQVSPLLTLPAGNQKYRVTAAGNEQIEMRTNRFEVEPQTSVLLIASGVETDGTARLFHPFRINTERLEGKARVYFINAISDARDIHLTKADDGAKIVSGLQYDKIGQGDIAVGTHPLKIVNQASHATLLDIGSLDFAAGQTYTIVAFGRLSGEYQRPLSSVVGVW